MPKDEKPKLTPEEIATVEKADAASIKANEAKDALSISLYRHKEALSLENYRASEAKKLAEYRLKEATLMLRHYEGELAKATGAKINSGPYEEKIQMAKQNVDALEIALAEAIRKGEESIERVKQAREEDLPPLEELLEAARQEHEKVELLAAPLREAYRLQLMAEMTTEEELAKIPEEDEKILSAKLVELGMLAGVLAGGALGYGLSGGQNFVMAGSLIAIGSGLGGNIGMAIGGAVTMLQRKLESARGRKSS